jgi:hypothetical protein
LGIIAIALSRVKERCKMGNISLIQTVGILAIAVVVTALFIINIRKELK